MEVMALEKFETPDRINLGQSKVVLYPSKPVNYKKGEIDSCVVDPENCGFVVISSYADCNSKEISKILKMTYRDFARLIATINRDERIKERVLKRAENEAYYEIKRLQSQNLSMTTILSAGKDFGLKEEDILAILKGD